VCLLKLELDINQSFKRKPKDSATFLNTAKSTTHPFKLAFIVSIKVILLETVELDSLMFQMA